jgi:hypothetical protein
MTTVEEMGPIDYVVIEWPDRQPNGSAMPKLIELVDAGIVRVLDLVFVAKDDDGHMTEIEIDALGPAFGVFDGARSGLLDQSDIDDAADALERGTSAALLIWENRWAAPFAVALRESGAQLVASGRIPTQQLVGAAG